VAVGLAVGVANAILDALCRSVTWSEPDAVYVQLHIGDPGAAGTSNPATETTRMQGTFGSAADAGAISNTAALTWTSVSADEDYTHISVWSAATDGTFLFSGTVTANAVTTGDTFVLPIGDVDVSLSVAS
jgi:hypothetical protein